MIGQSFLSGISIKQFGVQIMRLILGTNSYQGRPLDIVKSELPSDFAFQCLEEQTMHCFLDAVQNADYILAGGRMRITEGVLERAKKLKMIQRSGVGLDSLDLDAIKKREIPLYVNQGINAQSTAEQTLLLILACLRRLPSINENTKNGVWRKQEQGLQTYELNGKTVGVIGMGHIARILVSLLKPFHVNILYHSRTRAEQTFEEENNMTFVSLNELLSSSDVVTLHCALTEQTRGMIGSSALDRMKKGGILVNTARGGLVDTVALRDALQDGRLSYAALDVHEYEPIPDDYALKNLDNIILTPHIAGVTFDSFRAMMHSAFHNIECFENGRIEEIAPYRVL
jgi:D-3-phosphoglycerate dehydrogenase